MTTVRLVLLPDGPYEVTGSIELARSDGQPVQAPADKVYLCRCGHSANKPFCDGSPRPNRMDGGRMSMNSSTSRSVLHMSMSSTHLRCCVGS